MFDGQDIIYDVMLIMLAMGVPILLQFFYYRTNKAIQARQQQEKTRAIEQTRAMIQKMTEIAIKTANEVKNATEKVHEQMMATFRDEMHVTFTDLEKKHGEKDEIDTRILKELTDSIGILNLTLEKMGIRMDRIDGSIKTLQDDLIGVQDETDELRDLPPTRTSKRLRARKKTTTSRDEGDESI